MPDTVLIVTFHDVTSSIESEGRITDYVIGIDCNLSQAIMNGTIRVLANAKYKLARSDVVREWERDCERITRGSGLVCREYILGFMRETNVQQ